MGEIDGVAEELLDQRLVETELLADLLDRLLGRRGAGEIRRGIAGQRARQQEGDDHDPDQARDREQQALADHGQHGDARGLRDGLAHGADCSPPPLWGRVGDER